MDLPVPTSSSRFLLAIDTCGATGSVALGVFEAMPASEPATRVLSAATLAGKTYSASLISRIMDVLDEARLTLAAVNGLVVVNGPGSFTGVRVGVSAAKGLAEASGIPLIAISRLEMLARQASCDTCVALDAGRGEFYFALYREGALRMQSLSTEAEALEQARVAGLPVMVCEDVVAAQLKTSRLVAAPTAANALIIGARRFVAGAFEDVATLDGNYLRRPDAETTAARAAAALA